jgi:hypothetical protein
MHSTIDQVHGQLEHDFDQRLRVARLVDPETEYQKDESSRLRRRAGNGRGRATKRVFYGVRFEQ